VVVATRRRRLGRRGVGRASGGHHRRNGCGSDARQLAGRLRYQIVVQQVRGEGQRGAGSAAGDCARVAAGIADHAAMWGRQRVSMSRMVEGRGVLMSGSTMVQVASWWSWSLLGATGRQVKATGWRRRSRRMRGDVLRIVERGRDIGHQRDGHGVVVVMQPGGSRCSHCRMMGGRCVGVVVMMVMVMGGCCMMRCSGGGSSMMMMMMQLRVQLGFPRTALVLHSWGRGK